jgi:hypothetical protein
VEGSDIGLIKVPFHLPRMTEEIIKIPQSRWHVCRPKFEHGTLITQGKVNHSAATWVQDVTIILK